MTQEQQHTADDDRPMCIEPAHVMKREKHLQREHYERLAREAEAARQK